MYNTKLIKITIGNTHAFIELDLVDSISTLVSLISSLQSVVPEEQHQHHPGTC